MRLGFGRSRTFTWVNEGRNIITLDPLSQDNIPVINMLLRLPLSLSSKLTYQASFACSGLQ